MKPALIFLDFETDGLLEKNPNAVPLEVGYALTDWQGEIILERSVLIDVPDLQARIVAADSWCFETHTQNGLWSDLLSQETPDGMHRVALADLDRELGAVALTFEGARPRLAGFNPGFDYRFLRRYAPEFCRKIHYGVFDCSTLRELVRARYQKPWGPSDFDRVAHRGLKDVHAAIRYLRWFRNNVMVPYER